LPKLELSVPITVACTPERAFDWFADYHHVAHVLEGVSRWEPIGEQTQGVGARYAVELRALGFPLRSVLRLNRWRRPHATGWESESGLVKQEGGFTFVRLAKGVRIVLHITYEPPASFVGAAVARRLDGLIRRRLVVAMERVRATLERPV
jgi:Polyketide cyclase / dehydrase and lipid transport